jgi:hypothetical protein
VIEGPVARHPIVRRRPVMVSDGRGGKAPDWSNPNEKTIPGWAVDIGNTVEDASNRDGTMVAYTIRGPMDADVKPSDQIVLFGEEYEIEGGVRRQPGATLATSHMTLLLRKWTG